MERWSRGDFSEDPNVKDGKLIEESSVAKLSQNETDDEKKAALDDGISSVDVFTASLSTRGTGTGSCVPDPITVFYDEGKWPPAEEANRFLRLNPTDP